MMNLKINEINPSTWSGDEFVKITVLNDCNLNEYAITDETFNKEGKETDIFRHTYFFPEIGVKKDDTIFLYTSKGNKKVHFEKGKRVIKLYWCSDEPIWNNSMDKATLIRYQTEDSNSYGLMKRADDITDKINDVLNDEK